MSDPMESVRQQIDDLLKSGNKIEAIKVYREASGGDLKSAKEAVESRQRELERIYPELAAKKSGCLLMVLGVMGSGGAAAVYLC